jgi:S-adenosylmethionine:tRNA ribosyltransferase-isomerase
MQPILSVTDSIEQIIAYLYKHQMKQFSARTQIMIVPSFSFRLTTGMITNFHQPKSTLLLLVAAFIGEDWRTCYQHALDNGYRFLSYGDSSLLFPQK